MVNRALLATSLVAACAPVLDDDTSLVTDPRVLAVRAEPAEAPPNTAVTLHALWANPAAPPDAPIRWSLCTARTPVTEPGAAAPACFDETSPDLAPIGTGTTVTATLPVAACRLFGPDRPDAEPNQPAGRPVDPDNTGGFYQPVTLVEPSQSTVASIRLRCGFPNVTPAQAAELARRVRPNANPAITALTWHSPSGELALTPRELDPTAHLIVAPDTTLDLALTWPTCPASDEGSPCSGSEPYTWFDPDARAITTRREAMRVTWFSTAGRFELTRTGRPETSDQPTTENRFTTPSTGDVTLWLVLRDDRGGTTWASYHLVVE